MHSITALLTRPEPHVILMLVIVIADKRVAFPNLCVRIAAGAGLAQVGCRGSPAVDPLKVLPAISSRLQGACAITQSGRGLRLTQPLIRRPFLSFLTSSTSFLTSFTLPNFFPSRSPPSSFTYFLFPSPSFTSFFLIISVSSFPCHLPFSPFWLIIPLSQNFFL